MRKSYNISRFLTLILVACLITACGSGTQAIVNETWTLIELITKGERTDIVTEVVQVRNCGIAERKTVDCSAGTSNNLSVSLGGSVGAGTGFEGTIDASVSSGLGLGRDSGESLNLDLPPDGFIYLYTVNKKYSVLTGEVLARSTTGNERKATYAFHATCSLKIVSREMLTCVGDEKPAPTVIIVGTSTPYPTPPPAETRTQVTVLANQSWQSSGVTLAQGQQFQIEYISGEWTEGTIKTPYGPEGFNYICSAVNCCEPLPKVRKGSLIGKVGNAVFPIGSGGAFTTNEDGVLLLRINDCDPNLTDNAGSITIRIIR